MGSEWITKKMNSEGVKAEGPGLVLSGEQMASGGPSSSLAVPVTNY